MIYLQVFGTFQSRYLEDSSSILKFHKNKNNLFFTHYPKCLGISDAPYPFHQDKMQWWLPIVQM